MFFSPNGTVHRHWRPSGTETEFSFAPGSILEPLAAHLSRLVVLDELDFHKADNHAPGMAAMLTNNGGAATATGNLSLDQYVAKHMSGPTKLASLELGVQTSAWGGNAQTRMCYSGPDTFVTPDDDPLNVYGRLFGTVVGGAQELEKLRRRRASVLDAVRGDVNDLKQRLGQEERVKLEAHLESLRSMETSLNTDPAASCTQPLAPGSLALTDNAAFPDIAKAQLDLGVTALACGFTNVVSIQLSHTVGDRVYSWVGVSDGHHSLSHADDGNTRGVGDFIKAERWNAEQFAYLLGKLAALPSPDGAGSLLDDTVVLWAKELGDGRAHTCRSVPWVLAGGAGGAWRTGRYLKLGGMPHARVLVSICQAFGLTNDTFGDPTAGSGPAGVLS